MYKCLVDNFLDDLVIAPALIDLLKDGLVESNGCYFLKSLFAKQIHISASDFIDRTGYECFINSIHIDDYVENNIFAQSILFCNELIEMWRIRYGGKLLKIILGKTDFGVNLKFYHPRVKEEWINESDIDKFEEPIIIFEV